MNRAELPSFCCLVCAPVLLEQARDPQPASPGMLLVLIIAVPFPRHLEIFRNFTQMHGAASKYTLSVNTSSSYEVLCWCLLPPA